MMEGLKTEQPDRLLLLNVKMREVLTDAKVAALEAGDYLGAKVTVLEQRISAIRDIEREQLDPNHPPDLGDAEMVLAVALPIGAARSAIGSMRGVATAIWSRMATIGITAALIGYTLDPQGFTAPIKNTAAAVSTRILWPLILLMGGWLYSQRSK